MTGYVRRLKGKPGTGSVKHSSSRYMYYTHGQHFSNKACNRRQSEIFTTYYNVRLKFAKTKKLRPPYRGEVYRGPTLVRPHECILPEYTLPDGRPAADNISDCPSLFKLQPVNLSVLQVCCIRSHLHNGAFSVTPYSGCNMLPQCNML